MKIANNMTIGIPKPNTHFHTSGIGINMINNSAIMNKITLMINALLLPNVIGRL